MDPLASLSDIHLPAAVHSYPIAPGWWLLAAIVLALLIYGALKLRQYFVKRKAQKTAIKKLSSTSNIGAMVSLLKWASLQYFPREQVAHLTGDAFKAFLVASLPIKHQEKFAALSGEYFTLVYQSKVTSEVSTEFTAAAKLWLNYALPPQANLSSSTIAENSSPVTPRKTIKNNTENGVKSNGVKNNGVKA